MKNLENLGLIEINTTESININGGNWWDDLVDTVNETIDTVSDTVNDFIEGLYDNLPTDSGME